jgi:acyl-CoA thioester hydrolase
LVDPSLIDANGHMNVIHYLDFGATAVDALVRAVGITDVYRDERRLGVFTAEHHVRYYAELAEQNRVVVYPRVLANSEKVCHLMAFLVDDARQCLSATVELVLIHVDLSTRRPVPMPLDIAARFAEQAVFSASLGWAAPVCGVMGIRR